VGRTQAARAQAVEEWAVLLQVSDEIARQQQPYDALCAVRTGQKMLSAGCVVERRAYQRDATARKMTRVLPDAS